MPRMEKEVLTIAQEGLTRSYNLEIDQSSNEREKVSRKRLQGLVSDHPDFEVLCEPTLDPYHFRYLPNTLAERHEEPEIREFLDRLNEEIAANVQRSGLDFVTTTRVRGLVAIMVSIPNAASACAVDHTFEAIARWGRILTTKRSAG